MARLAAAVVFAVSLSGVPAGAIDFRRLPIAATLLAGTSTDDVVYAGVPATDTTPPHLIAIDAARARVVATLPV